MLPLTRVTRFGYIILTHSHLTSKFTKFWTNSKHTRRIQGCGASAEVVLGASHARSEGSNLGQRASFNTSRVGTGLLCGSRSMGS